MSNALRPDQRRFPLHVHISVMFTFLLLLTGVINLALGAWLWTGIPVSGLAIGLFVGIDLLMAGVTWMVMALAVRRAPTAVGAAA